MIWLEFLLLTAGCIFLWNWVRQLERRIDALAEGLRLTADFLHSQQSVNEGHQSALEGHQKVLEALTAPRVSK